MKNTVEINVSETDSKIIRKKLVSELAKIRKKMPETPYTLFGGKRAYFVRMENNEMNFKLENLFDYLSAINFSIIVVDSNSNDIPVNDYSSLITFLKGQRESNEFSFYKLSKLIKAHQDRLKEIEAENTSLSFDVFYKLLHLYKCNFKIVKNVQQ